MQSVKRRRIVIAANDMAKWQTLNQSITVGKFLVYIKVILVDDISAGCIQESRGIGLM